MYSIYSNSTSLHVLYGNTELQTTRDEALLQGYRHHSVQVHIFLILTGVNCSTPTSPPNGQVSHTAGTTFGQTATYSCNTGYNLLGSNTRTCQATGSWSGDTPTCQGSCAIFVHLSKVHLIHLTTR